MVDNQGRPDDSEHEDDADLDDPAGLVTSFRDAVAQVIPHDVEVRPADDGFGVGYPEPLVMEMGASTSSTTLWSLVRCDPSTMTFKIVDAITDRGLDYFDGSSIGAFRGRVSGDRVAYHYGTLPDGTKGLIRKHVHSARALHEAIRGPAADLGWVEKQPASAIVGLTMGVIGGVGGLVTLVVLGVLFATGQMH